jgi:hypothetical protein
MKFSSLLVWFSLPFALVCALTAQEAQEPFRAPDRGTEMRVHGIQVLPATGRPFSARDHIVWTRNLEDGTVITTELYAFVARDVQGRIFREHRSFVPLNSNEKSRRYEVDLLDPVSHTRTACLMAKHRCTIEPYQASTKFSLNPDGLFDHGLRFLTRLNLGHDVVDDLDVTGTRETLQINSGAVGNNQSLVSTRDFWYSPALQVNLSITRKDPRIGTQVLQLVDLSLTDPDEKIFQVPAGFLIQRLVPESVAAAN